MRKSTIIAVGLAWPFGCSTPPYSNSCLELETDGSTTEGVDVEGTLALYAPALERCGSVSSATLASDEPLVIDMLLDGEQPVSVQVASPAKGELHDCVARSVDRWRFDPMAKGRLLITSSGWGGCR
jgi:hypothetical protein